jgi:hypothetical protein
LFCTTAVPQYFNNKIKTMKKLFFTLLSGLVFTATGFGQSLSCGNSGAAVCTPGTLASEGFENPDSVECFIRAQTNSVIVKVKNFTQLTIQGTGVVDVYYLKLDSLLNLPCGVCWSTNKSNDVIPGGEDFCIKFTGLTSDQIGQYKIKIVGRAQITPGAYNAGSLVTPPGGLSSYENSIQNLKLYLRVKEDGGSCPGVDTAANSPANKIASIACTNIGIAETNSNFTALNIYPNPVSNVAKVNFEAEESASVTLSISDITGRVVLTNKFEATAGSNSTEFNRNSLVSGIYFLSIASGKNTAVKRFSIAE